MKNLSFKSLLILILSTAGLYVNISAQNVNEEHRGIRSIYLIRHGEYAPQDDDIADTLNNLTPLGIAQARLVSNRLKSMKINFNSLISSTMSRALQTAMVINRDFPEFELQKEDLIRECTPPTWRKDVMSGVDTSHREECVKNLERAFQKYFIPSSDNKDRNDIIVCHGNVIRYFVTKVLKVDTMSWLQMSIGNCSLTIIRIKPDGSMKLVSFNDVGHIPPNMQTETGGNNDLKELLIH